MTPTWIGLVVLLIGAFLIIRGSVASMFVFLLACSVLGGAAAIKLPALGGSSIPPVYFALGFLTLRIVLSGKSVLNRVEAAVRENLWLIVFCVYGAITAFIFPRLFKGAIEVAPLNVANIRYLLDADPLKFTPQNITSAIYLLGTLFAALCATIVAWSTRSSARMASIMAWLTWGHIGLGIVALILSKLGWQSWIDILRNGNYAQLDQEYGSFVRIAGFFPEASTYATFGFALFVLMTESWLRNIRPRLTGPVALAMGIVLLMSTSSSAYVGMAGYAVILVSRLMLFPGSISPRKILTISLISVIGLVIALIAAAASPQILKSFADMVSHMTVDKANSESGIQRRFWAEQGFSAFKVSWGLGIGAGSFRSSSLLTAILGSTGVVGAASFAAYMWNVVKPLRASSYGRSDLSMDTAFGASCGWAAFAGLIPAYVTLPSCDPGLLFGLLGGMAVAFRPEFSAVLTGAPTLVVRRQYPFSKVTPKLS